MSEIAAENRPGFHPRALAEVLLKVWAFTMLVRAILTLPMFFVQASVMPAGEERVWRLITATGVVQVALAVITAIAILRLAPKIASRLAQTIAGENTVDHTRRIAWEVLAFGLLGTYFLVEGLRSIAEVIIHLIQKPGYEMETMSYLWREAPDQLAGAIVMTIAGVVLFAGRKGIAALWARARG